MKRFKNKTNEKKIIFLASILAVVLIMLLSVGYLLRSDDKKNSSSLTTEITPLTNDWKTFNGAGFELNYPEGWVYDDELSVLVREEELNPNREGPSIFDYDTYIYFNKPNSALSLDALLIDVKENDNFSINKTTVNGYPATITEGFIVPDYLYSKGIYIESGEDIHSFGLKTKNLDELEELQSVFEEIISTYIITQS